MAKKGGECCGGNHGSGRGMCGHGIYGMAFVGAAVYWISKATTIVGGIGGFFKALFWPAFLMYEVLKILKM